MNSPVAKHHENTGAVGSWDGWRTFVVAAIIPETAAITSFILKPEDGQPVQRHRPGQYLTFSIEISGIGAVQRTYTISSAPADETYRISVKREADGTVSKWMHDSVAVGQKLQVGAPAGDFVLPDEQHRPLVLVSAGVGLTPMVSMLETIVRKDQSRPTFYVHASQDGTTHAMGRHVQALAAERPHIRLSTFYSRPRADDVEGRDFDKRGRISAKWLRDSMPADADFMICGPVAFLQDLATGLLREGIASERIHYEFFGDVEGLIERWPDALTLVKANTAPVLPGEPSHIPRDVIGEAFLDTEADAVIVSDRAGLITLWNPGATRIFGFTAEEAVGQSLDIITPEALRARHWAGYRTTVASGQSRYGAGALLAVPAICKDGSRISTEFTITMLKQPDGKVTGMIAVLRDVTARFEETRKMKKRISELESLAKDGG